MIGGDKAGIIVIQEGEGRFQQRVHPEGSCNPETIKFLSK